jgi:hypothetical protein
LKQTAIRIPEDLVLEIEFVARIRDISTNALIVEAVRSFLKSVASEPDFAAKAKTIMASEDELLRKLIGSQEN